MIEAASVEICGLIYITAMGAVYAGGGEGVSSDTSSIVFSGSESGDSLLLCSFMLCKELHCSL
jgi:hypothetical protein